MAHMYCPNCGAKMQYEVSPPNFCSGCGAPIGTVEAGASVPKGHKGEKGEEGVPKISKLEYEISGSAKSASLGEILTSQGGGETIGRPTPPKGSVDVLQASLDECKPSQRPSDTNE
jgi:hypothetical protein